MENRSKADSRGLEKPETSLARAGSVKAAARPVSILCAYV